MNGVYSSGFDGMPEIGRHEGRRSSLNSAMDVVAPCLSLGGVVGALP